MLRLQWMCILTTTVLTNSLKQSNNRIFMSVIVIFFLPDRYAIIHKWSCASLFFHLFSDILWHCQDRLRNFLSLILDLHERSECSRKLVSRYFLRMPCTDIFNLDENWSFFLYWCKIMIPLIAQLMWVCTPYLLVNLNF